MKKLAPKLIAVGYKVDLIDLIDRQETILEELQSNLKF